MPEINWVIGVVRTQALVRLDAHSEPFGPAFPDEHVQDMEPFLFPVGQLGSFTGIEK